MKRVAGATSHGLSVTWSAIATAIGPRELALLIGLGLLGYGYGSIWRPLGFIAPGAVLLYVTIRGLR